MEKSKEKFFSPNDPIPYKIINQDGRANVLLTCDHANSRIPINLDLLGLNAHELSLHIAYDIGALQVAKGISNLIDAPLVLAQFSRLVIDLNRSPDHEDSILQFSDKIQIPGNKNITKKARSQRVENIFKPYHSVIKSLIKKKMLSAIPAIISVHSFNPSFGEKPRPWDIGVLWKNDPRLAIPLIKNLREYRLNVGDNEPYSGHEVGYTTDTHGDQKGLANCALEINQDQLTHAEEVREWSEMLSSIISKILLLDDIRKVEFY